MALTLTRKEYESIQIGDDIIITIDHIQGRQVRVSIDAPAEVQIMRTELLDALPPTSPD